MKSTDYYRNMARYNRWMNERLYAICAAIPDAERKADRGAFFRSIHGTLNHLLLADRLWLGRFVGEPFEGEALDQELYSDFDELRRERAKTDDAIDRWVRTLTEEALPAPFTFRSIIPPRQNTFPLWHLAQHFFNHQAHHRGQLTTLLSQLGHDPGLTDLLRLPGAEIEG